MAKLRVSYPALVWQTITKEASAQQVAEVMDMPLERQVDFIDGEIKKQSKPEAHALISALETGYATIKRTK